MSARIRMIWRERYQQHNAHLYEFSDEYPSGGGTQDRHLWIALVDGEDVSSLVWKDYASHTCSPPPILFFGECQISLHRVAWFQDKFRGIVDRLPGDSGAFVLDEGIPRL